MPGLFVHHDQDGRLVSEKCVGRERESEMERAVCLSKRWFLLPTFAITVVVVVLLQVLLTSRPSGSCCSVHFATAPEQSDSWCRLDYVYVSAAGGNHAKKSVSRAEEQRNVRGLPYLGWADKHNGPVPSATLMLGLDEDILALFKHLVVIVQSTSIGIDFERVLRTCQNERDQHTFPLLPP